MADQKQNAEEIASKMKAVAAEFKEKSDGMLRDISTHFNSGVDSSIKNFTNLQSQYLQGYQQLFAQSKKGRGI